MNHLQTHPSPNEIEISVFGPGYGESILIHAGHGKWLIIDSCIDPSSSQPAPLKYLHAIGADTSRDVVFIVATHWHDDHIRGMSIILNECINAQFGCSIALRDKEFLTLAALYAKDQDQGYPGSREMFESLQIASVRKLNGERPSIKWAQSDRILWNDGITYNDQVGFTPTSLVALSPSDEMTKKSVQTIACAVSAATKGMPPSKLIPFLPNDAAVALRFEAGCHSVLLGSDLESSNDPLIGWRAVLSSALGKNRTSSVYKTSHHGSLSGDHNAIWNELLIKQPISITTPFNHGRHTIPTINDRMRILSKTRKAFISAHPDKKVKPKKIRSPKVEMFINSAAKTRCLSVANVGHVRWRAPMDEIEHTGSIELFNGALHLAETVT